MVEQKIDKDRFRKLAGIIKENQEITEKDEIGLAEFLKEDTIIKEGSLLPHGDIIHDLLNDMDHKQLISMMMADAENNHKITLFDWLQAFIDEDEIK